MNILDELCAARRADAEAAARILPLDVLERKLSRLPSSARGFRHVFEDGRTAPSPRVIAELKKASPSKGLIRPDFRPAECARRLTEAGAAALSVLVEPHRFLGGEDIFTEARTATERPLLYKDFVTTRYQIASARVLGADAVLLIAAVLRGRALTDLLRLAHDDGLDALVETHTADEIARAADAGARLIGVNCRDLRTFHTDPSLTARLIGLIPDTCVRIAESGLRSAADLHALQSAGADGFLIGETLMRAADPGAALKDLLS